MIACECPSALPLHLCIRACWSDEEEEEEKPAKTKKASSSSSKKTVKMEAGEDEDGDEGQVLFSFPH